MTQQSTKALGRIITAFLLKKEGREDRYQTRSDPVYQITYSIQRRLFGDRARQQKIGLLKRLLAERGRVTLLILGIEGDVLTQALESFHNKGGDCSPITVVIVDPIAEEIEKELESLRELGAAPGKVLAFSRRAEQLEETEWAQIRGTSEDFIVCALLTLHFICDPTERDKLFRGLHSLGRVKIALLEHDLNMLHAHTLHDRVKTVWDYYLPQFTVATQVPCASDEERQVLIARLALMVRDSLSESRDVLCLKYTESNAGWSARMLAAGFAHDPTPQSGDLDGLPGDGVTVYSWEDRWPALEQPYRFYLISKNYA